MATILKFPVSPHLKSTAAHAIECGTCGGDLVKLVARGEFRCFHCGCVLDGALWGIVVPADQPGSQVA